jgi:hypothetical protein
MSEIAAEAAYSTRSAWLKPVEDTHTFGGMALRAVSDHVRMFAEAFDTQRPPLYGHLVLARSALEGSVVSAWLSEPGITPLDRIKRGLCERLYSANEVKRLNLESDAPERVAELQADAASFGWEAKFDRGKPVVDGTTRPSVGTASPGFLSTIRKPASAGCSGTGFRPSCTSRGGASSGRSCSQPANRTARGS